MDNNSISEMWLSLISGVGLGVTVDSVTGSVSVDVSPEGVWTTTYTDWGFASSGGAAGADFSVSLSITGSDVSTGTFFEDGSFTFVNNSSNHVTTLTATAGGVNVPFPPMPSSAGFGGGGTYECEGDTMIIHYNQLPTPSVMSRVV
jgi:hypothetical protein